MVENRQRQLEANRRKHERRKLDHDVAQAIAAKAAAEKKFKKELREEDLRRRRYRNALVAHNYHTDPYEHLDCGECRLALANKGAKERYYSKVWEITEASFRKHYNQINPNNVPRGHEWHLDHKFSIAEGFRLDVDPEVIGSARNLEMLSAADNIRKKDACSITLEELTHSDDSIL